MQMVSLLRALQILQREIHRDRYDTLSIKNEKTGRGRISGKEKTAEKLFPQLSDLPQSSLHRILDEETRGPGNYLHIVAEEEHKVVVRTSF